MQLIRQLGVVVGGAAIGGLVAWGALRVLSAPPENPDLLIVTLDTTRADHLGLYGYPRDTSPHLDALGARALVFDDHLVPQATTLPSHVSLFTGVYPDEHGVISNSDAGDRWVIPEGLTLLASHLADHGYDTAGFVSATPLKRSTGIDRGFAVYDQPEDKSRPGDETVDAALAWLARPRDRPYLLWVHLFDAHLPYAGHPELRAAVAPDPSVAARWLKDHASSQAWVTRVNRYDMELRFADEQLGRLLEVADAGLRDPVVVVVGDHGEGLGQHNHYDHGRVWRGELTAPLVIRAHGAGAGRVPGPSSTVDVLPTLLGLARLPAEDVLLAQASGRDLLRDPAADIVSRSSLRQSRLYNHPEYAIPTHWALTTPEWTFVEDEEGDRQLYHRQRDPLELANVVGEQPELARDLSARLRALQDAHRARAESLGAGETVPGDATEREELEALGYTE